MNLGKIFLILPIASCRPLISKRSQKIKKTIMSSLHFNTSPRLQRNLFYFHLGKETFEFLYDIPLINFELKLFSRALFPWLYEN